MDFQTLVDTDAVGIKIEHDEAVMMLGSCFAEDVGNLLKRSMLALCINPFGTLYNPRSIAQSLRRPTCRSLPTNSWLTATCGTACRIIRASQA